MYPPTKTDTPRVKTAPRGGPNVSVQSGTPQHKLNASTTLRTIPGTYVLLGNRSVSATGETVAVPLVILKSMVKNQHKYLLKVAY